MELKSSANEAGTYLNLLRQVSSQSDQDKGGIRQLVKGSSMRPAIAAKI
jgi:hypothetical protein